MKQGLIVLAVLFFAVIFGSISIYNSLIALNENVSGKWSQIDNQLQRRNDLIPNLVNTVQGYSAHEQKAIHDVVVARTKLAGASGPEAKGVASGELGGAIGRLLAVVENYPDLKADKTFTGLMDELSGTENRIAAARRDYNDSVRIFNTKIRTFPSSIFADMLRFTAKEYFKVDESVKDVPQVSF
ncbi:MAG: LemA family protein [Endomicrobia bacterium]|nr:LemA family protein [Bacillota bacterium]MCL1972222.1 LemA family protein [Endomicrobiia bacterium]